MKTCVTCKHYSSERDVRLMTDHVCLRAVAWRADPVIGTKYPTDKRECYRERGAWGHHPGSCGEEGKFWEPK